MCSKITSKIHYDKILFVYEANNLIYFLTENATRSYDKTLQKSYVADRLFIDLCVYKDRAYEVYEVYNSSYQRSTGQDGSCQDNIRLDIFDITDKKYAEVDMKLPRKPTDQIIQDYVGHQIDRSDILPPKIIYSHLWPNYMIDRNAYCDIIITCSS